MNKKILFIWNYFYFPWEKGKSRFSDLALAITNAGYELEVVCSSFYHMGKSQRALSDISLAELPYKVHFIQEPGYEKNVSLKRIRSIRAFNSGLRKYLSKHEEVDLVYVPVPSCKAALIARKWCDRVGAKLVIDIEDLWPESFSMIIHPRWACALLTAPLKIQADRNYRGADGIVAVSQTYVDRALSVRKDQPRHTVAPIGSDYEYAQALRRNYEPHLKNKDEFWITYIGTLGSSYDIRLAMDACESVYHAGHTEVVLNVLGSGPDEKTLKEYSKTLRVPVVFYGLIPYEKMMEVLFESDLGLNPIVKGSVASLINKVGDYAAAGLPVLNSQECSEYVTLLEMYHAGISVPPSNEKAFAKALKSVLDDKTILEPMNAGALDFGANALSRKESEQRILSLIATVLRGGELDNE